MPDLGVFQLMRETSIISIIRKYGLNSKKLDPKYRVRFREALKDLSAYSNDELELVDVVDNVSQPDRSTSDTCMVCGKPIRYEYLLHNMNTGDCLTCGGSCCSSVLGLSKLQTRSFRTIEAGLREKAELEEWKRANPYALQKLEKLSEYDLPFFRPFVDEIKTSALCQEDTSFIADQVNLSLIVSDLKYLDALKDLIEYEPKQIYKSIRDHVLVQGKYLSRKQKEFVSSEYDAMLEKRKYVTFSIVRGYEHKEALKRSGYRFAAATRTWEKTIERSTIEEELEALKKESIPADLIKQK